MQPSSIQSENIVIYHVYRHVMHTTMVNTFIQSAHPPRYQVVITTINN